MDIPGVIFQEESGYQKTFIIRRPAETLCLGFS